MSRRINPNVASIPPGAPFLPTLVNALLEGDLIEGFSPGNDPLALADVTIWVPTRRAARELATEFVARLDGEVALLPGIKALGDVDDDSLFFEMPDFDVGGDLTETIGGLERQIILARLIAKWTDTLKQAQRRLYEDAEIMMPASFADATWFAQDLARLMDMVATEEASWSDLEELVPEDHADWWQLTLEFLKIATTQWPDILSERNKVDGATLRASHLRRQAEIYKQTGSRGPVIAAGSTGSIPATADLLKAIAHLENGTVVLPGLDRDIADEIWEKVDLPDNDRDEGGTAPGHPQFGLKRLVGQLGVLRGDVRHLGGVDDSGIGYARIREQLVSTALLPSEATGIWQNVFETFSDDQRELAFSSISLIEAANEREEALAIALALRAKLENKKKTAALVTPDRNLARRVAVELRRFGLEVDDSAGQPLRNRAHGTFARLVLQVAYGNADPIALASLIKHPLARFGRSAQRARHAAQMLELIALRGAIMPIRPGAFAQTIEQAQQKVSDDKHRIAPSVKQLEQSDWDAAHWLAEQLDLIFAGTSEPPQRDFTALAQQTVFLIEACGAGEDGELSSLYGEEDGKALGAFLTNLLDQTDDTPLTAEEWPDVFDALLASCVVRPVGGTHPRVSILGPLEARLQTFDRIVLGGLNEKTWPAAARNDPFLSRPMKSSLGLPPPERRTGLAAHDFQVLLGMEDVVITRAKRVDNAPTVASRWLQRLEIVAGGNVTGHMKRRGSDILDLAAQIDLPDGPIMAIPQPRPTPPVTARPTSMSITDIEKWIRDPYEIYAKYILKLTALEPLVREADARERGTLYHAIFEEFIADHANLTGEAAEQALKKTADRHFDESALPRDIAVLWRPRFETIAENFIEWHTQYFGEVQRSLIELTAEGVLHDGSFRLRGRADRIDVLNDGTLSIIDYKTGSNPKSSKVKNLEAPQLPLEAALAKQGAFHGLNPADASKLLYVRLRPTDQLKVDEIDAGDLAEKAWAELELLVKEYAQQETPYISKARLVKESDYASDYDHLARVREWALAEEGDES